MITCKVIDTFNTSWGLVAVLEFNEKYIPQIGDMLKSQNNCIWNIIGVSKSKFIMIEQYAKKLQSLYVFDCTLQSDCVIEKINISDILQKI